MFNKKYKILSMFSLIILGFIVVLPALFTGTVMIVSMLTITSYYGLTHYDIDFKYWLSFTSQLLGLIFFVISFLMVFTMGANLLIQ